MKVLVIGDEHTYGYGLPVGKLSYLGHFIRLISRAGQHVSMEAYAHLTLPQLASTLAQLPLNRYDLIILQFDDKLLRSARAAASETNAVMPILPYPLGSTALSGQPTLGHRLKTFGNALLSTIWPLYGVRTVADLLRQLRPYRHNVLLLTPLPKQDWLSRWVGKRSRAILLSEADEQLFSVFDTDSVIQPKEEYFLPNNPEQLSAVSHELLGRELFDFYQSAPTIVTIQSIRRDVQ
ncbi:SGNH/GDSL hydrolase family protein [Spirosoma koreense]